MILKRIYDDLLSQTSYLLGCEKTGIAVVIDPNRESERYVAEAEQEKLKISFVTETHIHADFVSGARSLARATGAELLLSAEGGNDWSYRFAQSDGARLVRDGDTFDVGRIRLQVLHTPGHTPEHICFLVTDTTVSQCPLGLVSGDFIFVGDVGRPDLLEKAAHVAGTADTLARQLFHSIRATSNLGDYLQVWPGHGAGSACGKGLGAMPSTTLGYERLVNWAFQISNEDDFVRAALTDQPEPPPYFARMKQINRDGPPLALPSEPLREVTAVELRDAIAAKACVIDARSTADFSASHIPGTLSVPMGTSFATWAGWLVPENRDIIILADNLGRVARARHALSLIGLDRVVGRAGAETRDEWRRTIGPLESVALTTAVDVADDHTRTLIDVRRDTEWNAGHAPQAVHRFLGTLLDGMRDTPKDEPIAMHCQGGTRSGIASALLQANGYTNVMNMKDGFDGWTAAGLPIESSGNHTAH
ncbi:MAG: rhodanese-like domain-containing protein [Gemmatimonadaceae bacterium]